MDSPKDKTILIVDDEPDVRQYLKSVLEDAGFNVLLAEDGEVATKIINESRPDLISLDLNMPKKSGHKLLFELKRDPELSRIPVLVVTAHAKDHLGKRDLDDLLENRILSGPGTYLEKPVRPMSYVRSVQRALGIEESEDVTDRIHLAEELSKQMRGANADALKKALEALKKKKPE